MWGMAPRTVAGLVIRSTYLELLAMQGGRVVASARIPIEGDEPQHLTEACRQALEAPGLSTKKLAVAIESRDVLFRFFTLPVLPKAEWDAAVQFEARRYIPFKTDALVWDHHTIQRGKGSRLETVFASLPREIFERVQGALNAAGLQPTLIEPRSASLARLVAPADGAGPNEFVCVVDVEPEVAHLSIANDGLPYLTRDITLLPSSGAPGDATAVVQAPGAPPSDPGGQAEPADGRLERLFSELSVSIDFFMREYPSTSVSRVVLCGERQRIERWCQCLSGKLVCPVESASGAVARRVQGDLELSFASAVGLLQRAGDPRERAIDFLRRSLMKAPPQERKSAAQGTWIGVVITALRTPQVAACTLAVAGALAVLWGVGRLRLASVEREFSRLVASRPQIGWGLNEMSRETLEPVLQAAIMQSALLSQVMDHRVSVAAKLDALARSLPDGLWLNTLSFENPIDAATGQGGPQLAVQGACFLGEAEDEVQAIQQFEEQMKRHPTFLEGFSIAQLEQISAMPWGPSNEYTYRAFQFNCEPERRL